METKHITLLVGAAVVLAIGFFVVKEITASIKPAVNIDDQMNLLRSN